MEHIGQLTADQYEDAGGVALKRALPVSEEIAAKIIKECDLAGFKRAITKLSEESWSKLAKEGKLDDHPDICAMRERSMRPVDKYMWITVNPEFEDKPLDSVTKLLIKQVTKYCRKKSISNAIWSYEQKGENEENMGTHPHCHMLVEFDTTPKRSVFQREIKNTFKDLCKDWDAFIHCRVCQIEHIERRIKYMQKRNHGDKLDVVMNKTWRIKYGLEDLQYRGPTAKKWAENCLGIPDNTDESDSEIEA